MEDKIIIAIVVVVVLGAHVWLFMWIKFKIDEGTVVKFLKGLEANSSSLEAIASNTSIAQDRVATVCGKSKLIKRHATNRESWCLN